MDSMFTALFDLLKTPLRQSFLNLAEEFRPFSGLQSMDHRHINFSGITP